MKEEKNYIWIVIVAVFIAGLIIASAVSYNYYEPKLPKKYYEPVNKTIYYYPDQDTHLVCYQYMYNPKDAYESYESETSCYKTEKRKLDV